MQNPTPSSARGVFSITAFPVGLGGSLLVCAALLERGWDPQNAFLVPTVTTYLLLMGLERAVPFRPAWSHSRGDVSVDLGHMIVSGGLTLALLRPAMLALGIGIGGWLTSLHGSPVWPVGWPLAVQLLLALCVGEFFLYWVHRWGHEWDFLWRFHAVHHSAPRLYFLNAARFHPVDLAISNYAPFVPLVALGASPEVLALFGLVSAVHGAFQHTNLPLRLGPLNWFFSMAELHRWHHSRLLDESNTNFGQNLIIWDIVFGTRYLPEDREPPEDIGLTDLPAFPMDYKGQLLSPLHWRRIHEESA